MSSRRRRAILVPFIIALNILVFFLWRSESQSFMLDHFAISYRSLQEGRYLVLLTSIFSHTLLIHLLINMFVLNSFGSLFEILMGPWIFLKFYLLAGLMGSLSHALVSYFLLHRPEQYAVGASGALAGLILLFSLLFPKEKIYFFGLIPIPALFGALAFIALDVWGLVAQTQGGGLPIGHGAHLGGAAMGIFYYAYLKMRHRDLL